ncbi:MAG: DUF3486 family protein [Betaproteobacteria bacterium]|nr:DUF3486 family protein [Betaproteobacteria bacterium]
MRRSKVSQLPKAVLDELNARLVAAGFSGYRGLVEWLNGQGIDISLSGLYRHGSGLQKQFEDAIADARRTRELARAVKESGENEDGALMQVASEIMQDNLLRVSLKAKEEVEGNDTRDSAETMATIAHAFANVGRFDLSRRKWQAEVKKKLDALETKSRHDGMSLDMATLNAVKEALYGG